MAWLRSNLGIDTRDGELYQTEWVLFRGDPKRNGMAAGDFPLMHFRWRVRTVLLHKHMEFIDSQREKFLAAGKALIPISQPLVVGDVVLMRTPERVLGVDLRTGKRIWDYPWFQDSIEFQADQTSFESYGKSDAERDELTQRLWEDAPYGQLSSDGERVYLLDELEPAPTSAYPQNVFMPRGRGQASDERRHNQLVACQLAEEGKLKWIVGGATGVDEPQLAGAFFLGPPLPLMGDLFALAEIQGEIRLVVLDAATGKLKWFQQVAHVAELTIDVDRTRRLAGAVPSFDDGVLICPTAAGACVAIDLATRSFLWGYQYNSSRFVRRYGHVRQQSAADRWLDGTAVISDGCVVLTPIDSNQLHCLDLLTGQRKWPPLLREKLLFVGGVYDGVIFVVGENVCRGIRLADGKPAWEDDLALGTSRPSGRGFLSGAFYYLPTTDHKLLKIDIRTGEVVQESTTDRPLGNLVAYRDQIISYDADQLGCYYQVEALRQLVEKRLKKSPDDHWALLHRAELLLHDGKQTEALADLRRAHKLAPDDTMTR
ncbi:MAG TPA: hypothetical protein ENJ50_04250, partial [Planctomycetaceae bacterium]|nr:hypothetical protein [Planctomycetaceae bacterium]